MQVKARIEGIYSGEYDDVKTNSKKPYHQLEIIDTEATKKEILRLKLKAELLDLVSPAVGKIANINVDFQMGKLVFVGFVK